MKLLNAIVPETAWIPVCKTGNFISYRGMLLAAGTEVIVFSGEEGSFEFVESELPFAEVISGLWLGARFVVTNDVVFVDHSA